MERIENLARKTNIPRRRGAAKDGDIVRRGEDRAADDSGGAQALIENASTRIMPGSCCKSWRAPRLGYGRQAALTIIRQWPYRSMT